MQRPLKMSMPLHSGRFPSGSGCSKGWLVRWKVTKDGVLGHCYIYNPPTVQQHQKQPHCNNRSSTIGLSYSVRGHIIIINHLLIRTYLNSFF